MTTKLLLFDWVRFAILLLSIYALLSTAAPGNPALDRLASSSSSQPSELRMHQVSTKDLFKAMLIRDTRPLPSLKGREMSYSQRISEFLGISEPTYEIQLDNKEVPLAVSTNEETLKKEIAAHANDRFYSTLNVMGSWGWHDPPRVAAYNLVVKEALAAQEQLKEWARRLPKVRGGDEMVDPGEVKKSLEATFEVWKKGLDQAAGLGRVDLSLLRSKIAR